ncbi:unnamed protein product, partial [Ilex paraguariensis]
VIDLIEGLFLTFLAVILMGALLHFMARTKRPGPGPRSPPTKNPKSHKRSGEGSSKDPNVQRKKAKKDAASGFKGSV